MSQDASESTTKKLRFESGPQPSPAAVAVHLAESIAHEIGCDAVTVTLRHQESTETGTYPKSGPESSLAASQIFSLAANSASFAGRSWSLPIVINDLQRARVARELALELAVRKVRTYGAFPISVGGKLSGVVECFFTRAYHRWRQEELEAFSEIGSAVEGLGKEQGGPSRASVSGPSEDLQSQYRRMARYGNIIILMTDADFGISDVFGNTEQLIGIPASKMLSDAGIWDVILDPRDRDMLRRRILRLRVERDELREEVRLIHQRSGEVRWMMLRAVPHFSADGSFLGWEGFGIDVTERRQAQELLVAQNKRLEALFEVGRAVQGPLDPMTLSLKGLSAVLKATGSHCGYVALSNPDGAGLEVVAAQGLSEKYLETMGPVLTGPSLLWHTVGTGEGHIISDMQSDPRAAVSLAKLENIRSALVVPLVAEGQVLGGLALFKRVTNAYAEADYDLAQAAAAQISLAIRQGELFESERRHNESLSALYRVSQELGKHQSISEIAQNVFPILESDFGLRRGWLGILNDQGTHIVGQAGFGPGVSKKLQQVQVETSLRHDAIDEAVRTQRPVIVKPSRNLECSGLNGILERLSVQVLVVIPLVSLGQTVGVMALEPRSAGTFEAEGRLQLLVTVASEMATVFMARRFEQKMSDALKMRTAGLLAAGVAHNFNNLLQAILGQVSLVQLQAPSGSQMAESANLISEAAKRGATLVSQLLNFSAQSPGIRQHISVNEMLSGSTQLYESLLGRRLKLEIDLGQDTPDVVGDSSQLQQVVTALLANAKDAIPDERAGAVTLTTTKVRLRTGEVHPELPPGVYVRLDVKDNGVGMSSEQRSRCFEPFYTTKNVDPGTGVGLTGSGLGLSAAYALVRQHGGIITVDSSVGRGTVFSVYLPVLSVHSGSAADASTGAKRVRDEGVLLLGVEPGVQTYLTSLFESLGCKARFVYDLRQAQEVLQREPDVWRFVAVDLDTMADSASGACAKLLGESSELCIVGLAAVTRDWTGRLPRSTRIELIDKPVGVWAAQSALDRLRVRPERAGHDQSDQGGASESPSVEKPHERR